MYVYEFVCVSKLFFLSGTTGPNILKFATNTGYDLLYSVSENKACGWFGTDRRYVTHISLNLGIF